MNNFETFNDLLQGMENKGRVFESFCCWFISRDPDFAEEVTSVWLWEDWPDRWGPDCGIDLVVKTKTGKYWAVQCKCYSDQNTITKQDLDSFLSESNRRVFEKRLLLSTTDGMGMNALRTCEGQEKPIQLYMKDDFARSHLNFPETKEEIESGNFSNFQDRKYSDQANEAAFLKLKRYNGIRLDEEEREKLSLIDFDENISDPSWWENITSLEIPEIFSPLNFEKKIEKYLGITGITTTPIHLAVSNANLNVVTTLFNFGVDIEFKGPDRETLATSALSNAQHPQVLEFLLDNGCTAGSRDHLFCEAIEYGAYFAVEMIHKKGLAKGKVILNENLYEHLGTFLGEDNDLFIMIAKHVVGLEKSFTEFNDTLFHIAISDTESEASLMAVIEAGIDHDCSIGTPDMRTPIFSLIDFWEDGFEMRQHLLTLLNLGVEINGLFNGLNAFQYACSKLNASAVSLFLNYNIDFEVQSVSGNRAVDFAISNDKLNGRIIRDGNKFSIKNS